MRPIHTSIRVNTTNEADLNQFIRDKGGVKSALVFLYNAYKVSNTVDDIVDRLKNEIQIAPTTTIKPKADNKKAINILNNFTR